MKDENEKHSNEDLEWIYQEVFGQAVEYMKDFDVQAVAATYMAIAMRLSLALLNPVLPTLLIKLIARKSDCLLRSCLKRFMTRFQIMSQDTRSK